MVQGPLVAIADQPFSADEVNTQNPTPNVHCLVPMKTIAFIGNREDVSVPRDPIAAPFVNIEDPIAGVHYYLDTEKKIARRLVYPRPWKPAGKPS